jgi:hypothetical protein
VNLIIKPRGSNQYCLCIGKFLIIFPRTPNVLKKASCTMGTGSFPRVKRPRRVADHPPPLAPRSRRSRVIPLPPSGLSGLLRDAFTFTELLPSVSASCLSVAPQALCSMCVVQKQDQPPEENGKRTHNAARDTTKAHHTNTKRQTNVQVFDILEDQHLKCIAFLKSKSFNT